MRCTRICNEAGSGSVIRCAICAAVLLITLPAHAQRGTSPTRAEALIDAAIEALIDEAARVHEAPHDLTDAPDFATRWERADGLDAEALGRRIVARIDKDPFVDAYVRWQLTSCEPALPAIDDRAFLHVMDAMPPLMPNPAADPQLVRLMEQADTAEFLTDDEREYIRRLDRERLERTRVAESLCRPAQMYRDWFSDQFASNAARTHMLLCETCAATIAAGWSTRSIKTQLTRALREWGLTRDADDADDTAQRRAVVNVAQMLAGRETAFVNTVTFMANGTVNVRFSRARVTQRDVDRWADLVYGRH